VNWYSIFKDLGTLSIVGILVTYLIKNVFDKQIEKYKEELKKNTSLQETQIKILNTFFRLLFSVERNLQIYRSTESNEDKCSDSIFEFFNYWNENKIFFDEPQVQSVEKISKSDLFDFIVFHEGLKGVSKYPEHLREAQWNHIQTKIEELNTKISDWINGIKISFKEILPQKSELYEYKEKIKMNILQRIILGMGAILIALCLLFPPWMYTEKDQFIKPGPYSFLSNPPVNSTTYTLTIDPSRLFLELVAIFVVFSILYIVFSNRDKKI
jgi:hypothetical protein